MKRAVIQCADTGPLESLVCMLRSVGYECLLPSDKLKNQLRQLGCDTVLDVSHLVQHWGYEQPMPLGIADDLDHTDLYVDVKAHRSCTHIVRRWPSLAGKVLWYRINGGKPEHVINARGDHGDEIDPPCPVLTPNQWYSSECLLEESNSFTDSLSVPKLVKLAERSYTCWPPFVRFSQYGPRRPCTVGRDYDQPLCLIHNLAGWGYGALEQPMRQLGVHMFGMGSPDGLVKHGEVREYLKAALCLVHLKSSDAPGYSLYEALASGCPVVCTRRLIWRCRMQELLIPGKTCLVFDRETHDGLTEEDVRECTREVSTYLEALANPAYNRLIGEAGRERLKEVMWSPNSAEHVDGLAGFMRRNFQ